MLFVTAFAMSLVVLFIEWSILFIAGKSLVFPAATALMALNFVATFLFAVCRCAIKTGVLYAKGPIVRADRRTDFYAGLWIYGVGFVFCFGGIVIVLVSMVVV